MLSLAQHLLVALLLKKEPDIRWHHRMSSSRVDALYIERRRFRQKDAISFIWDIDGVSQLVFGCSPACRLRTIACAEAGQALVHSTER